MRSQAARAKAASMVIAVRTDSVALFNLIPVKGVGLDTLSQRLSIRFYFVQGSARFGSFPVVQKFGLMYNSPLAYLIFLGARQSTFRKVHVVQAVNHIVTRIPCMKVWTGVVFPIHRYNNAAPPTEFRHGIRSSACTLHRRSRGCPCRKCIRKTYPARMRIACEGYSPTLLPCLWAAPSIPPPFLS